MIVIKISPSVACSIPTISFAIVDFPNHYVLQWMSIDVLVY